jgi:membrane protease subunit HflK
MRQGPWGERPSGPGGRGRGNQPLDLEEVIRKSQERLEQILRGGGGRGSGFGRSTWIVIALIVHGFI